MQSTRKCIFASMFNAAHTQCRLAISLLCSPHACAGLRPPCLAAYTRVQVCNPFVMQPTRKCGFALTSPCRPHAGAGYNQTVLQPTCNAGLHLCYLHEKSCCHAQTPPDKHTTSLSRSPHAGAGLRPHCHAAHTHARVCTAKSCAAHTRARVCIRAPTLSTYLAAHKQARCDYVVNLAHSPGSGHTQAQSCICALCPYGCSPGALDLPCCVTDSRAAEGGDCDASGAGGPTKTLFASLDISISCDKDKDLDGQRHAMPLAMHVEKDLLDRFLEVCVCHTLLDC